MLNPEAPIKERGEKFCHASVSVRIQHIPIIVPAVLDHGHIVRLAKLGYYHGSLNTWLDDVEITSVASAACDHENGAA